MNGMFALICSFIILKKKKKKDYLIEIASSGML